MAYADCVKLLGLLSRGHYFALGIGATTVIFSVVNTVLLRPLPYKDSPRIAEIYTITPLFPEFQLGESKPDFDDIKSGTHAFESLALFQNKNANLTAPGTPEQISSQPFPRSLSLCSEFLLFLGAPFGQEMKKEKMATWHC